MPLQQAPHGGGGGGCVTRLVRALDRLPLAPPAFEAEQEQSKSGIGVTFTAVAAALFMAYSAYIAAMNEMKVDAVATTFARMDMGAPYALRVEWNPRTVEVGSIVTVNATRGGTPCYAALSPHTVDTFVACPSVAIASSVGVTGATTNALQPLLPNGAGYMFRLRAGVSALAAVPAAAQVGTPGTTVNAIVTWQAAGDAAPRWYVGTVPALPTATAALWSWDGTTWRNEGLAGAVEALLVWRGALVAVVADGTTVRATGAHLNALSVLAPTAAAGGWVPLGGGVTRAAAGTPLPVAIWNDALCVGGALASVGGVNGSASAACWNGTAWMARSPGWSTPVTALAVHADALHAFVATPATAKRFGAAAGATRAAWLPGPDANVATSSAWLPVTTPGMFHASSNKELSGVAPLVTLGVTSWVTVGAAVCVMGDFTLTPPAAAAPVATGVACLRATPSGVQLAPGLPTALPTGVTPVAALARQGRVCVTYMSASSNGMALMDCWDAGSSTWVSTVPLDNAGNVGRIGLPSLPASSLAVLDTMLCVRTGMVACFNETLGVWLSVWAPAMPTAPVAVVAGHLCAAGTAAGAIDCWNGVAGGGDTVSFNMYGVTLTTLAPANVASYSWSGAGVATWGNASCFVGVAAPASDSVARIMCVTTLTGAATLLPAPVLQDGSVRPVASAGAALCTADDVAMLCWNGTAWDALASADRAAPPLLPLPGGTLMLEVGRFNGAGVGGWGVFSASLTPSGDAAWSQVAVPGALASSDAVRVAATWRGALYMGGSLAVTVGGVTYAGAAGWNGSALVALDGGPGNDVVALLPTATALYVGGTFDALTASRTQTTQLAAWDGEAWTQIASSFAIATSWTLVTTVKVLLMQPATPGGGGPPLLLLGGIFKTVGGAVMNSIAQWNASTSGFSALGSFTHAFTWTPTAASVPATAASADDTWVVRMWGSATANIGVPLQLNVSDVLPVSIGSYYGVQQHNYGFEAWTSYHYPEPYAKLSRTAVSYPVGGTTGMGGTDGAFSFCPTGVKAYAAAGNPASRCCMPSSMDLTRCPLLGPTSMVVLPPPTGFAAVRHATGWYTVANASAVATLGAFLLTPDQLFTTNVVSSTKESGFTLFGTAMGALGMLMSVALIAKKYAVNKCARRAPAAVDADAHWKPAAAGADGSDWKRGGSAAAADDMAFVSNPMGATGPKPRHRAAEEAKASAHVTRV